MPAECCRLGLRREFEHVEQLRLPDTYVTNIAFGGEDMRTAFVTLSQSGRVVKMRWPEPGLKLNFSY